MCVTELATAAHGEKGEPKHDSVLASSGIPERLQRDWKRKSGCTAERKTESIFLFVCSSCGDGFADARLRKENRMNIFDACEQAYKNGYEAGKKDALAEREETVCQLRKKWQAAVTHICTMCGHFDHKTDGNIVYGNKSCGEIVGYPVCGKFTPWIPVTERLPEHFGVFIVAIREPCKERVGKDCADFDPFAKTWLPSMCWDKGYKVTHWMPLPEPPKE